MPKLEHLVDMFAEQLNIHNTGQGWYTPLDMRYAYGQVRFDKKTAKHCTFQKIGKATGTYRFITGFYGLIVMPTKFLKEMDMELSDLPNTYVFLDDLLIVTKGTQEENHYRTVKKFSKD